jgi:dolichyl-diphosphooligosaccharide--protein glycosyltransferase
MTMMALAMIFAGAIIIRSLPAKYGFFLNEFDPFYDYKATQYIVERVRAQGLLGLFGDDGYFKWVDKTTWYPEGRAVAATSQAGLHMTGAFTYLLLHDVIGLDLTLYDYLIIFPVIFGSLTILVLFLLARRIADTGGGLIAALLFAFSPAVIQRGNLGWYKSEPLGVFLALLATYLLLISLDGRSSIRGMVGYSALAGALYGISIASWGGSSFFLGALAISLVLAVFFRVDHQRLRKVALITPTFMLLTAALFPRPGPGVILNLGGLALYAAIFLVLLFTSPDLKGRGLLTTSFIRGFLGIGLFGLLMFSFGLATDLSLRYYSVIAPFQRGQDALVESVAEHFVPTGGDFISNHGILIFIAGFGALVALRRRSVEDAMALTISGLGIYTAASFSRLMLFATLGIALLSAIGIQELATTVLTGSRRPVAKAQGLSPAQRVTIAITLTGIIALSIYTPISTRGGASGWLIDADAPTSLSAAALPIKAPISDWIEALAWIRENTPSDAVIASWWDYGYWINVLGNRTTLADNATINSTRIALIGRAFMSDEATGVQILRDQLKAQYVVVMVAVYDVSRISQLFSGLYSFERDAYGLSSLGGDGSKMQWFAKIPGLNPDQYLDSDGLPRPSFWTDTLLGKLFPFDPDPDATQRYKQLFQQQTGFTPKVLLVRELVHYSPEGGGPLKLVFMSSGKVDPSSRVRVLVLVYQFT